MKAERYLENDPAADILIERSETFHDDRGRTYQTKTYAVDPSDGTVGSALAEFRGSSGDTIHNSEGRMMN